MLEYKDRMNVLANTAMHKDLIVAVESQRIFAVLCNCATDYHEASNVSPVRLIREFIRNAFDAEYSDYMIRKHIAVLREIGLVERTTCGFPAWETSTESGTDGDVSHPPINGFGLTKKGFESHTYKQADKFQDDMYREMCNPIHR